jgi:two-component system, LytTR family, response regulator
VITAYLVDDEALALRRLARMLEETGRVTIAGQSTRPVEALAQLAGVDVVFLDISMPELDGFEVCARLPPNVMVVFTTAHDEHALRAFGTNALDYLLKPIREAELTRALDKLERMRVLSAAEVVSRAPGRIASRLGDRIQLVELERITHFQAEDKLTYAVTAERSHVVDATITELEQRYSASGWFRIHRATLVRLAAIVEVRGTNVRLATGQQVTVARDRAAALRDRLGIAR